MEQAMAIMTTERRNGDEDAPLKPSKDVVPLNTWVLISNLKLAYNLIRGADGSFNRNLAEFLDRKVGTSTSDGVAAMDVTMDRLTGLWSRIFLPQNAYEEDHDHDEEEEDEEEEEDAFSVPIIFYFHGGSYAHSSANSTLYDSVCRRLAKSCRAVVISVNYRRSPEHRFPAAYEDGIAALRWLKKNVAATAAWLPPRANLSRCYLIGDSSGGNMVHHVGVAAASLATELWPLRVAGHILMIPMFGGKERTASEMRLDGQYFVTMKDRDYYWKLFLPLDSDRDHPACNIFGPNSGTHVAALKKLRLPQSLVVVAGLDLMQDWQLRYVDGMKRLGQNVELLFFEESPVGFFIFPNTHHFHTLMSKINHFVHTS